MGRAPSPISAKVKKAGGSLGSTLPAPFGVSDKAHLNNSKTAINKKTRARVKNPSYQSSKIRFKCPDPKCSTFTIESPAVASFLSWVLDLVMQIYYCHVSY